jgi:two-component system, OmpR family, phosphate regulon response regulator OmpR
MSEMHHVLVVDDDARLRSLLRNFLSAQGYRVSVAANAATARRLMQGLAFDAMIVDVMMPGETGLSFVQDLRSASRDPTDHVPVLMLSALSETKDRIAGLSSGSDDYLAKPFEPEELLLRLKNLLRRNGPTSGEVPAYEFGPFSFHLALGELRKGESVLRLTSGEKDILRLLVKAQGKAMSREELAQGEAAVEGTRRIDVQINRLRQKIEVDPANPRYLQTVRGQGYALIVGEG